MSCHDCGTAGPCYIDHSALRRCHHPRCNVCNDGGPFCCYCPDSAPPAPFVDVQHETAYGQTTRLPFVVRVF